jgi:multisubunit Na+/H+ antiporter MnhG subunit
MKNLLLVVIALLAGPVLAQQVGQVTHLSGTLIAKRPDGTTKLLSVKSAIQQGDTLSTEDETYARIKFADNGELVLRPNTQLKVEAYSFNDAKPESDNVVLNMLKGGFRAVTGLIGKRNQEKVNFNTTTATIGIRGTHLGALFCQNDCGGVPTPTGKTPDNGLHVDVAAGAVVVTPKLAVALPGTTTPGAATPPPSVVLNAGQFGYLPPPQNGVQPPLVIVPPSQGIQVTMPPSISQNKGGGAGIGKSKEGECAL